MAVEVGELDRRAREGAAGGDYLYLWGLLVFACPRNNQVKELSRDQI